MLATVRRACESECFCGCDTAIAKLTMSFCRHYLLMPDHWNLYSQWSPTGVSVKGKAYQMVRLHFTKRRPPMQREAGNANANSVPMEP